MNFLRAFWCRWTGHRWQRKRGAELKRCVRCAGVQAVRPRAPKAAP